MVISTGAPLEVTVAGTVCDVTFTYGPPYPVDDPDAHSIYIQSDVMLHCRTDAAPKGTRS